MGLLVSQTSASLASLSCFQISASLCHNQLSVPLVVLIDSGAKESFLDLELAIQPVPS